MKQPMTNYETLPSNLPVPVDDGLCDHLPGMMLPAVRLPSTRGREVGLAALPTRLNVIFCYPMTGKPGTALPAGWDDIPGVRGCTPQACSFRDNFAAFADRGVVVFGLSAQSSDYQREMTVRLHIPYEVLSDEHLNFTTALRLPTFVVAGAQLIKRLTLIVRDGMIERVLYPVFPPNLSAEQTLAAIDAMNAARRM
jgi:peroxiredoxin